MNVQPVPLPCRTPDEQRSAELRRAQTRLKEQIYQLNARKGDLDTRVHDLSVNYQAQALDLAPAEYQRRRNTLAAEVTQASRELATLKAIYHRNSTELRQLSARTETADSLLRELHSLARRQVALTLRLQELLVDEEAR